MATNDRLALAHVEYDDDIIYPATIPFVLVHLSVFLAFWTGVQPLHVAVCLGLYVVRMFIVTAGYHRYFSHKTFKTSRVGQFVLAFLCQTAAQRGVVWWAAKHRHHHKHSDTEHDVHSPRQKGFLFSHVGWIFTKDRGRANYDLVKDLTQYPELMWLDRHQYFPAFVMGAAIWLIGGWPLVVVGFLWSTVLLYHGSFSINSLAHVHGKQRYITGDDSRNNWWLALITLGEGWHNNHHYFQSSTRQGFRWYEIDITFYCLKVLSWLGIVWDLKSPPPEVIRAERRLGRIALERAAGDLAKTFCVDSIVVQVRTAWAGTPRWEEFKQQFEEHGTLPVTMPAMPQLPNWDQMRKRARKFYNESPSLDDVVHRAQEMLYESVGSRLFPGAEPTPA